MSVLRYTVLRLLLFLGCLLAFFLVKDLTGIPTGAVVILAAVASLALSLVVLRGPREELAARMAQRVDSRLPARAVEGSDEAVEDAEVERAEVEQAEDERRRRHGAAGGLS
ncbi:MAG: DUF4229 domain-containing protein [Actinomycetales bacterium]